MTPEPRTPAERRRDTLHRLEHDVDCWVATADAGTGEPYLTPLSFRWDGSTLLVSTPTSTPTGRNLRADRTVRVGIGETRDVVLVEATVEVIALDDLPAGEADAFAAACGFDPRREGGAYAWYRLRPVTVQAWREANELAGRTLLRDGAWVV